MNERRPRPTRRKRENARIASYAVSAAWAAGTYLSIRYDGWADALFIALCTMLALVWMLRWELWRADADRKRAEAARKSERRIMSAVSEACNLVARLERQLELVDTDTAYYEITRGLRELGDEPWPGHAA